MLISDTGFNFLSETDDCNGFILNPSSLFFTYAKSHSLTYTILL